MIIMNLRIKTRAGLEMMNIADLRAGTNLTIKNGFSMSKAELIDAIMEINKIEDAKYMKSLSKKVIREVAIEAGVTEADVKNMAFSEIRNIRAALGI